MQVTYFVSHNFKVGTSVPPHTHNCYELIFSKDSVSQINYLPKKDFNSLDAFNYSKQFTSKTAKLDLENNSFLIIPPEIIHDEHHLSNGEVFAIGFNVSEEEMEIFESQLLLKVFKKTNDLLPMFDKIVKELFGRNKYSEMMVNAFLVQMFVEIHRKFVDNSSEQKNFDHLLEYLDQYFLTNIDVESLAKQYNYSESHFRFLFKKVYQVSIGQYLINKRIEYIKRQLEETDIPIKNIANSLQFVDYSNFSNFFKKHTGLSPRNYRHLKRTGILTN